MATQIDYDYVVNEGKEIDDLRRSVMVRAAAYLKQYEHPGIVIYPDHCSDLLDAIQSDKFNDEVGTGSVLFAPIKKWKKCNAKNRKAIARVEKELNKLQ